MGEEEKKYSFNLISWPGLARPVADTVRWATEPTEMCAKLMLCYWHKNLAHASHYSCEPARIDHPTRNSPVSTLRWYSVQNQKQKLKSYKSISSKIHTNKNHFLWTQLWEISNKRDEKKNNLDECQHRMPECSLEIIILCSLLELWSTKFKYTHTPISIWNDGDHSRNVHKTKTKSNADQKTTRKKN